MAPATPEPAAAPQIEVLRPGPWLAVGPTGAAEWARLTLPLSTLPPGRRIRLTHLTDLHLKRRPHPILEQIVAALAADPPDAVLVTGDFVDDKFDHRPALAALRATLPRLTSRLGTFAVLGNHDGDLLAGRLHDLGVRLVVGRERLDCGEGGPLDLIGLPGVTREDPPAAFEIDRDPRVPTVALSHYPDAVKRLGRLRPDLVLAGHTHGGQICLPGGRPLITHDALPRQMSKGLHRLPWGGHLFVSRGIGTAAYPVRLFCPAQVVEIVLTSTANPTPP